MPTTPETRREVAERLVRTHCAVIDGVRLTLSERALADEIEAALKDRDERAAKIAKLIPDTKFDLDHEPAQTEQQIRNGIAAAIGNEES